MNEATGQCWTPTSLWTAFQVLGRGKYIIDVDNDVITIHKTK